MVNTFTLEDIIKTSKYSEEDWHPISVKPSTYTSGSASGTLTSAAFPTSTHRALILQELVQDGYWVKATGSRVTQDGWSSSSDWDYVVFDPDVKLMDRLITQGWMDGTSGREDGSFASLRMGEVNLILVKEEDQWKKWIIATNMIKALNSESKEERIKVFDGVFGKDKNAEAVLF